MTIPNRKGKHAARIGERLPPWVKARMATRALAFKDDSRALEARAAGCRFCAALDAAFDSLPTALSVNLDELERQHGECTCLAC